MNTISLRETNEDHRNHHPFEGQRLDRNSRREILFLVRRREVYPKEIRIRWDDDYYRNPYSNWIRIIS